MLEYIGLTRNKLLYILIICATVCACAKSEKQQEQQTKNAAQEEIVPDNSAVEEVVLDIVEEVEQPMVVEDKPAKRKAVSQSNSYSESYSTSSSSSLNDAGDYWEEMRKHSPNDNYLLGFDEDVDDVHDMELYMEDY